MLRPGKPISYKNFSYISSFHSLAKQKNLRMKDRLRQLLICSILLIAGLAVQAQDSAGFRRPADGRRDADSSRRDTTRRRGGGMGMASLFADSAKMTSSDYQQQIENTYVILNNVENKSE